MLFMLQCGTFRFTLPRFLMVYMDSNGLLPMQLKNQTDVLFPFQMLSVLSHINISSLSDKASLKIITSFHMRQQEQLFFAIVFFLQMDREQRPLSAKFSTSQTLLNLESIKFFN